MERIIEILKQHYIKIILLVIITVLGIIIGFLLYKQENGKTKKEVSLVETKSSNNDEIMKVKKIKVDVKGEVNSPGVYELDNNCIIMDALTMAGGVKENGTTENINLSYKLTDGMAIVVYDKNVLLEENKEIAEPVNTNSYDISAELKKQKSIIKSNTKKQTSNVDSKDVEEQSSNEEKPDEPAEPIIVNINTAAKEELLTLTGIGESKADNIIKYREENGLFESIEQLKEVSGIGEAIFEKIKDFIIIE